LVCDSHNLCTEGLCESDFWSYEIQYADEVKTKGNFANEVFTFPQSNSNAQTENSKSYLGAGFVIKIRL